MKEGARPPRENLVRAISPGPELREADGTPPTMTGHFSVTNQWTRIESAFEGTFMERFASGAWTKTISENRSALKVLFNHGRDPQIGNKPLGPIETLREDDKGAYYEVPLLDTSYNRDLLPGLKAGLYGASMRFNVVRDDPVYKPKPSSYNPDGIPERTVTEAKLLEFGPVTFPAYQGATAGVRSLTDEYLIEVLRSSAPSKLDAAVATPHLEAGAPREARRFKSDKEWLTWLLNSKT